MYIHHLFIQPQEKGYPGKGYIERKSDHGFTFAHRPLPQHSPSPQKQNRYKKEAVKAIDRKIQAAAKTHFPTAKSTLSREKMYGNKECRLKRQ